MVDFYDAADGPAAFLSTPGGRLEGEDAARVFAAADALGGELSVTARGRLLLRSVSDVEALRAAWRGYGSRHRVLATPRSAVALGHAREIARLLDEARLSRTLTVGVDDGTGDIATQRLDALVTTDVSPAEAVARITGTGPAHRRSPGPVTPPIGWLPLEDGRVDLAGVLPLGIFPPRLAELLAALARPVTLTPWRSLIIHELAEGDADAVVKILAPWGVVFDAGSPWLRVTSCVGRPGCAQARSDVRADAARLASADPAERVHLIGCARGCGRPSGPFLEYEAHAEGEYETAYRGM